ncbi:MAG: tRNA dihydrouridine synthase DusB [Erysipelotrichaceae bacterium]|nr:tRNA dihydrouridine synthase DusB [Erysipelotrichaceae bacterium]
MVDKTKGRTHSMRIGDLEINGKVILGPMAGITTLAYREFMKPFGVALSYSEMISDCGIAYENKRTYEYLKTSELDSPVGLQLFGFDIKNTAKAIEIVQNEAIYDVLDINLGCPVHKVTKTGAGSSWLRNIDGLRDYMHEVCRISTKPVTAKIRLGWDENSINVFEVSKALEEVGVKAVTVHCRTKEQGYSGKANYHAVSGLKETLSIPLIVSGDIFTLDDAIKCVNETNADGVMVARGGVGNPYLVTQIDHYFKTGEKLPSPTVRDQLAYARSYASMLIRMKGEEMAIRELKGILPHFFSGFPGYKKIRLSLTTNMSNEKEMEAIFNGAERELNL